MRSASMPFQIVSTFDELDEVRQFLVARRVAKLGGYFRCGPQQKPVALLFGNRRKSEVGHTQLAQQGCERRWFRAVRLLAPLEEATAGFARAAARAHVVPVVYPAL